jgi:hypothetical protein
LLPESLLEKRTKLGISSKASPLSLFQHQMHHHCESGAVANMLNCYGYQLSEAMVFGIGAGLYFAHVPIYKTMGAPTTTFRYLPGSVFKQTAKALGIEYTMLTTANTARGMALLDQWLAEGKPVGLFTNMQHLDYLPSIFRFEFSAHNVVVYGKSAEDYLISDSILDFPVKIKAENLVHARFGSGILGSNGRMYAIEKTRKAMSLHSAIRAGISMTCKRMLFAYLPWSGLRGMNRLAKQIAKYPHKYTAEKTAFNLTNIVRMQEVVGTGGAGFRLLYAKFLAESSTILNDEHLKGCAAELHEIAHQWRQFALLLGKTAKQTGQDMKENCMQSAQLLQQIALQEFKLYKRLLTII